MNGRPTQEIYFEQGLRQGDPLSLFLFLLLMEALHISFVRAMDGGFFNGIYVGSHEPVHISHLFYADNAMFIGEWRDENLRHLVSILQCFYLASGLRINIHKCCIMGVGGVTNVKVNRGDEMNGCEASKIPFKYLGVMVDGKMNRLHSSDVVIDKGLCDMDERPTKWLKLIPNKVNVLAWWLASNKLPTRFNMSVRGLEIQSMVCPVCHVGVETSDHLFFSCLVASSIMAKVLGWWGILDIDISSYQDWVKWFEGLR
ncbi:RNA-directed DNA polymerase, eukaryota [Tanacetum coccineum]|uniref:RNA-directed DNA polymerase, eukaryota n=1 Tax=Tanacetum coccineum TaxID=301880 RepID=A0ABQ5I087_9ASTR